MHNGSKSQSQHTITTSTWQFYGFINEYTGWAISVAVNRLLYPLCDNVKLFPAKNVYLSVHDALWVRIQQHLCDYFTACGKITLAVALACAVTVLWTDPCLQPEARTQCILVHVNTARTTVSRTNSENSALSVNIAQTEEFNDSGDYSYHQHWLDIHMKRGGVLL